MLPRLMLGCFAYLLLTTFFCNRIRSILQSAVSELETLNVYRLLTFVDVCCPSAIKQLTPVGHKSSGCKNQDLDSPQKIPEEGEYNILIVVRLYVNCFVLGKRYS